MVIKMKVKKNIIKKLRIYKGFSQSYVAEKLKLTYKLYRDVEDNKRGLKFSEEKKIADLFGVRIYQLYEEVLNMAKKKYKNNVQKYRVWRNLLQRELAEEINISKSQLRNIELNKCQPGAKFITRLCDFFGVSFNQLFYKEEDNIKIKESIKKIIIEYIKKNTEEEVKSLIYPWKFQQILREYSKLNEDG